MKKSQTNRLPSLLPYWVQERIEVNVYKLNRFMSWASTQIPTGATVLDAGSGEGRFRPLFSHTRYFGVDLAIGDVNWDYKSLHILADLINQPFSSQTFDAVICTQVLEHVREPQKVLNEISRVLKPGGSLYLSAPQSWHQHQKPHDYYRYTSFGLQHLLENSQLHIKSIEPMGGYFWFLSFQIQNIIYWTFYDKRRSWITWPLRAGMGFVFQLVLPLILFYLDELDPIKDETLGYVCVATKPFYSTS